MAVATRPKRTTSGTKTASKPRSAKAPAHSWNSGTITLKGNGKTILEQEINPRTMATLWAKIPTMIAKNGPAKYTIGVEVTAD